MSRTRRRRSLLGPTRQVADRRRTVVAAVLVALVCLAVLVVSVTIQNGLPGSSRLTLEFRDVGNLARYDDVRIAGRRVGVVGPIAYERGVARVEIDLEMPAAELRSSTRAVLRLNGLLGAQYVELEPGDSGPPLRDGGLIPYRQTRKNPALFDTFQSFRGRGLESLRKTVQGLGGGFAGRGERLNEASRSSPALLRDTTALVDELNRDPASLRRLFPGLASFVEALEPVSEDLARGLDEQERALRPLAENSAALRAVLRETAQTVRTARRRLAQTAPLLRESERLSRVLRESSSIAPDALRSSTRLLRASRDAARGARSLLRVTRESVPPQLRYLNALSPLIEPLARVLKLPLPMLDELFRRGRCELIPGALRLRSAIAYGVPRKNKLGAISFERSFQSVGLDTLSGLPDIDVLDGKDWNPAPCTAAGQRTGR